MLLISLLSLPNVFLLRTRGSSSQVEGNPHIQVTLGSSVSCFGFSLICFGCLTPDPATMLIEIHSFATTKPLRFSSNGLWPSTWLLITR